MVMIYFKDHHLLFTMRTDQRIIAKRRKDRSTPPVKTTESMALLFRNSEIGVFYQWNDVWHKGRHNGSS